MNYPLWDLPAAGLLIAFVAIVVVAASLLTKRYATDEKGEARGAPL